MPHAVRSIAVLVLMLCMAGCSSLGHRGLSDRDESAQRQLTTTWENAANARDWNALASTYATNATLMPPNEQNIQGRENIKKFFVEFPAFTDMKLNPVDIGGGGDVAYVRGTYSLKIQAPDGSPVHDVGKYLEIRTKQSDGSWLILLDMFSSDLPAAH